MDNWFTEALNEEMDRQVENCYYSQHLEHTSRLYINIPSIKGVNFISKLNLFILNDANIDKKFALIPWREGNKAPHIKSQLQVPQEEKEACRYMFTNSPNWQDCHGQERVQPSLDPKELIHKFQTWSVKNNYTLSLLQCLAEATMKLGFPIKGTRGINHDDLKNEICRHPA